MSTNQGERGFGFSDPDSPPPVSRWSDSTDPDDKKKKGDKLGKLKRVGSKVMKKVKELVKPKPQN